MKLLFFALFIVMSFGVSGQQLPSQVQAKRGVFTERLFLKDRWIDRISTDLNTSDSSADNVLPTGKAIADYTRLKASNYIQNQISAPQQANLWIQGPAVIGNANSYRQLLQVNAPASLYVSHLGGYGLSVQSTGSDPFANPQLTFFQNGASDFNTLSVPPLTSRLGVIRWTTVTGDNSTVIAVATLQGWIEKIAPTFVSSGLFIHTRDTTGNLRWSWGVDAQGSMSVGRTTHTGYKMEVATGGIKFDDMTGSGNILIGSDNNGGLRKVKLGTGLSFSTNGDTLNTAPNNITALRSTLTYDFPAVSNNSSAATNVTISGAAVGDMVLITKTSSGMSNGETYTGFVSAANTVTIRLNNNSGGSFDLATESYNIMVLKY